MANLPTKITKFVDLQKDFGTSIAQALWQKAVLDLNYINASHPIGMLIFVRMTQPNIPGAPDPMYWKLCDGTAVTNSNSPLFGVTIPDLQSLFLKQRNNSETNLTNYSADTRDFTHAHGGVTGTTFNADSFNADDSDERPAPANHNHSISNVSLVFNITPPYRDLRIYVRIV